MGGTLGLQMSGRTLHRFGGQVQSHCSDAFGCGAGTCEALGRDHSVLSLFRDFFFSFPFNLHIYKRNV